MLWAPAAMVPPVPASIVPCLRVRPSCLNPAVETLARLLARTSCRYHCASRGTAQATEKARHQGDPSRVHAKRLARAHGDQTAIPGPLRGVMHALLEKGLELLDTARHHEDHVRGR